VLYLLTEPDRAAIYSLFFALLFFSVSVVIGQMLFTWHRQYALRRKLTKRVHRAAAGEKNAYRYLCEHGFTVIDEQVHITKKLSVDGITVPFALRADFIVRKGGRNAVVDAKSGAQAADPKNPETRRRMLEYFCYYDVHDAFIYDDISKSLKKIKFTDVIPGKRDWKLFAAGIVCGGVLCILSYLLMIKMV
jgi:hypothetical protein